MNKCINWTWIKKYKKYGVVLNGDNPIKNGDIKDWNGIKLILKRLLSDIINKEKKYAVFIAHAISWSDRDR